MRFTLLGLFAVIVISSTTNTSIYLFILLIITKLCLSHKFWINFFVIFCNTIFRCRQVHTQPLDIFVHQHKANIERRDLSGVVQSLWGISWLWFKLSRFSEYYAIHYCNQPVLSIALNLNVTYSVLWLLMSFREAPW